jgi:hypothetical protein
LHTSTVEGEIKTLSRNFGLQPPNDNAQYPGRMEISNALLQKLDTMGKTRQSKSLRLSLQHV